MAQVGAAQPVPATAGAKRVKFDDDLVLDEGGVLPWPILQQQPTMLQPCLRTTG